MRKFSLLAALLLSMNAFGAMTVVSPTKSPFLGANDGAKLVDESGNRIQVMGFVYPDANGHTGLSPSDIQKGTVSPVTGLEEPALFKLASGKQIPLIALTQVDPISKLPVPFTVPGASVVQPLVTVKATYSFALSGGAVGDHPLDVSIPANAIVDSIYGGTIDVITGFASAGGTATVALKAESAGDLLSSGMASALTAGIHSGSGTPFKTTAVRVPTLTVGVEPLTAGKFYFFISYHQSSGS
jgi:hypothetical protein